MENEINDLTRSFVARLEAYTVERINSRLRDLLAIGLVAAPEKERASVRSLKPTRRPYRKSKKWFAAQRARSRTGKGG